MKNVILCTCASQEKNVLENREITLILKGEMSFATETSLAAITKLRWKPGILDEAAPHREVSRSFRNLAEMIAARGEGRACVREYGLDFGMENGPDQASRPAFADCTKLPRLPAKMRICSDRQFVGS